MKIGIKEYVFVALMTGLIAGSYSMVVGPHEQRRQQTRAQIRAMDSAMVGIRQATEGVDELQLRIAELDKAIKFFQSKLTLGNDADEVVKQICQTARANSLQVNATRPLRSEAPNGYGQRCIEMSVSGDFNGFYSFLLQLEKQPRITRIPQMKLEKIDDRDGEMHAELTLSIVCEPGGDKAAPTTQAVVANTESSRSMP